MVTKIAISGKAKSGKNTIAEFIADYLIGSNWAENIEILAFADPMKQIAKIMFPEINDSSLWGPSQERATLIPSAIDSNLQILSCRKLLHDIGKFGRAFNLNIWINAVLSKINSMPENYGAVISDVRFKNELKACKENNFILIRVVRQNNDSTIDDISEVDLDDVSNSEFDFIVNNDGSLEELENKIVVILHQIRKLQQV